MTGPNMAVKPEASARPIRAAPPAPPVGTRTGPGIPHSGSVLLVGREASVQFAQPIRFLMVRALDYQTYDGWCWVEGYELDAQGDATEKRRIYVMLRGLRVIDRPKPPPARRAGGSQH